MVSDLLPWIITVEIIPFPSTNHLKEVVVLSIHPGPSWMDPILTYTRQGNLLVNKLEAEKIRQKSPKYWMSTKGKLYKRSYSRHYILYVPLKVVEALLEELHEGVCRSHTKERFFGP